MPAATKEAEVNVATQLEPYPTGNPPEVDMLAVAHPQIALQKQREAEAEAGATKSKSEREHGRHMGGKAEPYDDDDDDRKNGKKGRK